MKLKSILCVVFAATLLGSCSYDDGDLWDAVNDRKREFPLWRNGRRQWLSN